MSHMEFGDVRGWLQETRLPKTNVDAYSERIMQHLLLCSVDDNCPLQLYFDVLLW